jgi:Tfp pilus assembly protein PilP
VKLTAIALSMVFLLLAGCQQEQNVPTASDFANEREKLVKRVEARKEKKAAPARPAAPAPAKVGADGFLLVSGSTKYDPVTMRDPFRSFEWKTEELLGLKVGGPLEQFDLSQLNVVAVVWKTGSARALVLDPSGQSYIVGEGARIGKNDGTVVGIDDNLVIVKETYVDYLGHETKQDVEMRIRRSEGG